MGHHIIATSGFEFAASLEPMARMRNRLVHIYGDIDPERVHDLLRTRLGHFDRFAVAITEYLDRTENPG